MIICDNMPYDRIQGQGSLKILHLGCSTGRFSVLLVMFLFLFLSPGSLRAPSTDRRETLPHYRKVGALYKLSPKIRGAFCRCHCRSPPKKWPKTCKISGNFLTLQTLDLPYTSSFIFKIYLLCHLDTELASHC